MGLLKASNCTRYWIGIALLAFCVQFMFASAHAASMATSPSNKDSVQPSCHSDQHTIGHSNKLSDTMPNAEQSQLVLNETTPSPLEQSCCDGDCSMLSCHIPGLLHSAPCLLSPRAWAMQANFLIIPPLIKRNDPLLRPPILVSLKTV